MHQGSICGVSPRIPPLTDVSATSTASHPSLSRSPPFTVETRTNVKASPRARDALTPAKASCPLHRHVAHRDREATSPYAVVPRLRPAAYAGGFSLNTSVENGSTPGISHLVHISSILAWK